MWNTLPQVRVGQARTEVRRVARASRVDYGSKYCHDSPTLREGPLQAAILAAINTAMSQQEALMGQIEDAMRMELIPFPGAMSISDIDRRLDELDKEFQGLFADSKEGGFMKHAESIFS